MESELVCAHCLVNHAVFASLLELSVERNAQPQPSQKTQKHVLCSRTLCVQQASVTLRTLRMPGHLLCSNNICGSRFVLNCELMESITKLYRPNQSLSQIHVYTYKYVQTYIHSHVRTYMHTFDYIQLLKKPLHGSGLGPSKDLNHVYTYIYIDIYVYLYIYIW